MTQVPTIAFVDDASALHPIVLEGVRGFFKGFTPIYARLAPHQLVMFSVLEALSSLLTGDSFV